MIIKQKVTTMWGFMIYTEASIKIRRHAVFGFRNKQNRHDKRDIYFAHRFL